MKIIAVSLVCLQFWIGVGTAISQEISSVAGRAGSPFRIGFGARGIGMGNTVTSIPQGDIASYYNPALLPYQDRPVALLSYGSLAFDRKLNYASYAQHVDRDAGISFGIINSGVGSIGGRDLDGNPTETYSTSENQFFLSFGLRPSPTFSFGVTAKILYYSLFTDVRSTTFGMDFGGLYRISDELTVGLVVQDVLSKYKWDTTKLYGQSGSSYDEKFPLRRRLGLSYILPSLGMILASDVELIASDTFWRIGAEVELLEGFQIRGGIDQIAFSGNFVATPSLGLAFQTRVSTWTPRVDYAFVLEPYSPSGMHFLTLSLRFQ